jgi:hypothetical protein
MNDFDILAQTDEHLVSLACVDFFPQKDCISIEFRSEDYWWFDMCDIYKSTDISILNDTSRVEMMALQVFAYMRFCILRNMYS